MNIGRGVVKPMLFVVMIMKWVASVDIKSTMGRQMCGQKAGFFLICASIMREMRALQFRFSKIKSNDHVLLMYPLLSFSALLWYSQAQSPEFD